MKVKVTVTAEYKQTFTEEDINDLTYDGKSFEECFKDNFENWRLTPKFKFEYVNE